MMKSIATYAICVSMICSSAFAKINRDQNIKGSLQTGIWYLKNNVSDYSDNATTYTAQDGYGNSYVQDDYMLFHARMKLDTGKKKDPFRMHAHGRFLYNIKDTNYTIGINERYRYQFKELNVELNEAIGKSQIFLGRKTNYQVGGISIDGLTMIFQPKQDLDIGLYSGLGVDPRQFTGYIGPDYRENPINFDYLAGGLFTSLRKPKFQFDLAFNSLLHEFSLDRMNAFTHFMIHLHDKWSLSGLLDIGVAGDPGLIQSQAFLHTRVTSRITNQFGFHRYRSVYFDQSDASGVPVPSDLNPNFTLSTITNTSHYQTFSNHTKFKFQKNYIFTRFSFSKRGFDDLKRRALTVGYRDPNIAKTGVHTTLKTSLIDNYKSYHAIVDLMLGIDIIPQKLEFEAGGAVSYNERQVYQNFMPVDGSVESEQESVLRANVIYQPTLKMAWYIQYRMYNQIDAVNNDQKITLHEVFLSTNLRF